MTLAPFPLLCRPSPPMLRCNDRIGALRAMDPIDDSASDAAMSRLPRLRVEGVFRCGGSGGKVGELGGDDI